MKLILTQVVEGLGNPGDIVSVKDGFGRNYLRRWRAGCQGLPRPRGAEATSQRLPGPTGPGRSGAAPPIGGECR